MPDVDFHQSVLIVANCNDDACQTNHNIHHHHYHHHNKMERIRQCSGTMITARSLISLHYLYVMVIVTFNCLTMSNSIANITYIICRASGWGFIYIIWLCSLLNDHLPEYRDMFRPELEIGHRIWRITLESCRNCYAANHTVHAIITALLCIMVYFGAHRGWKITGMVIDFAFAAVMYTSFNADGLPADMKQALTNTPDQVITLRGFTFELVRSNHNNDNNHVQPANNNNNNYNSIVSPTEHVGELDDDCEIPGEKGEPHIVVHCGEEEEEDENNENHNHNHNHNHNNNNNNKEGGVDK
jgi:hypothetical protein